MDPARYRFQLEQPDSIRDGRATQDVYNANDHVTMLSRLVC